MMAKLALMAIGAAAGLLCVAYACVWLAGESILARTYEIPDEPIKAARAAGEIAEGARLAAVYGCRGCHNDDLNGQRFGEAPLIFRSTATNLARLAKTYSDADFERAIRHGVKRNKRSVNGMPSSSFASMRDEDLSKIIGFIRTQEDKGADLPPSATYILGRLELVQGMFPPDASRIDHAARHGAGDFSAQLQRGRYLATLVCSECHGLDFTGDIAGPPDLAIAASYTPEAFARLMRTGEPLGGRDLRLMDEVSIGRFSQMTDSEIADLYAFLVARADYRK